MSIIAEDSIVVKSQEYTIVCSLDSCWSLSTMSNTKEHNIELKGNCIVDTKFADAGIILRTMSNTSSLNNELNVKYRWYEVC